MFRLLKAHALCYRFYDVADSIDLERVRALVSNSRRLALTRTGSEYIQLSNPPLSIEVGRQTLELRNARFEVDVVARLFDHGAISVMLKVPLEVGLTLTDLTPLADELFDSPKVDGVCEQVMQQLRATLAPAFEDPHLWDKSEAYMVLFAQEIEGNPKAAEVLKAPELPRLLLGESPNIELSQAEVTDVLERHFSYTEHDLAVIDWNGAFIYEPSGSSDIPDLLEVANAQLLELRYYDDVLDKELGRLYDVVGAKKKASLFNSPYRKLLRELMLTLMEISEFVERIENSLKIIGDVYLARVYEGSLAQLRVSAWQDDVNRKQKLLFRTYEILKGEVDTDRTLTLELMIVALIVLEVLIGLGPIFH